VEKGSNMAVRRKFRPLRRRNECTTQHIMTLLEGYCFFKYAAPGFYDASAMPIFDAWKQAWQQLRSELLREFIAENPGKRPFAWWKFDAPEPMRRLIEGYDFQADPEVSRIPRDLVNGWYSAGGWEEFRDPPIIETESAYLDRHGLLTAAERKTLGDFPTEEEMCCRHEFEDNSLPDFRKSWPPHKSRDTQ
jgi:hypothetical protein